MNREYYILPEFANNPTCFTFEMDLLTVYGLEEVIACSKHMRKVIDKTISDSVPFFFSAVEVFIPGFLFPLSYSS